MYLSGHSQSCNNKVAFDVNEMYHAVDHDVMSFGNAGNAKANGMHVTFGRQGPAAVF